MELVIGAVVFEVFYIGRLLFLVANEAAAGAAQCRRLGESGEEAR